MDRKWYVRFRQFRRGRRSVKNAIVTAGSRKEVREMIEIYFDLFAPQASIVSIFEHKEG